MERFKRLVLPDSHALTWKAAIPVLGLAMAFAAALAQAAPDESTESKKNAVGIERNSCSRPQYPDDARRDRLQGMVTVAFLIDVNGNVKQSNLVKSSGHASLDEAALSALSRCRFKPAMREGQPVQAWVPIQYVWILE